MAKTHLYLAEASSNAIARSQGAVRNISKIVTAVNGWLTYGFPMHG